MDIAFLGLPIETAALKLRTLNRERLGAVLPTSHRLARESSIEAADLRNEDFISLPIAARSAITEATLKTFAVAGFQPNIVQEVEDPYVVMTLVAAELGVAIAIPNVLDIMPDGVAFVPLRDEAAYYDHAIAWSARNDSIATRAVLEIAETLFPSMDVS